MRLPIIFVLLGFAEARSNSPPEVEFRFPDIADKDFSNDTVALISNSNAVFELLCNATYPIEWIFHYSEEDDGTSEQGKIAETRRYVEDFNDPDTYRYSAKIRLEYKGKLLVFANFTCKATQDKELQTHVYMRDENKKAFIVLEISQEDRVGEIIGENPDGINSTIDQCESALTTVSYDPVKRLIPCWTCETPMGKQLELDYDICKTPIQCNSIHSRQNKGKSCLNRIEDNNNNTMCKIYYTYDYNPKVVVCKNYGPALAQFYYFGIFVGDIYDETIPGAPIYFDWSEIEPEKMLYVHPVKKNVYQGEEIMITCEYSRYYFSFGSFFAIRTENSTEYIPGKDVRPCETGADFIAAKYDKSCNNKTEQFWRGTFTANLTRKFDRIGLHEVFCFGPVWNTTEWINTSLSFEVKKGEAPEVLSVTANNNEDFIIGHRHRSLICSFKGKPVPSVKWVAPNESVYTIENDQEKYTSRIIFSEIGFQMEGDYTCIVTSHLGSHSKSFRLNPKKSSDLSKGAIIGITIGCLIVTIVVIVVIERMRRIIVDQRTALRLLTEAEIKEFVEGNPEIVEQAKDNYFTSATAIDALPYDKKFEIPEEKIFVDYSSVLGCGEFGIVLKGKISGMCASQYYSNVGLVTINPDCENNIPKSTEPLNVAVKICKKDVDVSSFKALLSEIKVMAYLGHHKNIVGLIGASTHKIRNRKLMIATEFCENGSLHQFLKEHKQNFLNKVKYGYFCKDDTGEQPSVKYLQLFKSSDYVSSFPPSKKDYLFSSVELFKWTREIAEAVEYMHGKKVIHGDLAIRNVLLTYNLTAKVGDFGLSRQLVETASYTKRTQCPLPWRNMAIESLNNLEFSVKSDMWSLGVTFWELYSLGEIPYGGWNYGEEFVTGLQQESLRLSKPLYSTNDIYEFMLRCWEIAPADRPDTVEIIMICDNLLKMRSEEE